jgi:hypothetical protein
MNPESAYIYTFGGGAGITMIDLLLICLCPLCAMMGTLVSSILKNYHTPLEFRPAKKLPIHLHGKKDEELTEAEKLERYNEERRMDFNMGAHYMRSSQQKWLLVAGLILGFVVSLYFVGAITHSTASLARVLGLCVLLGYQAPNIWFSQEKVIKKLVDARVAEITGTDEKK